MTDAPDRRASLWAAKLRGSLARYWPDAVVSEVVDLPFGSAVVSQDGATAWVVLELPVAASLGGVLAWAAKSAPSASTVHALLPSDMTIWRYPAGVWARLASYFDVDCHIHELTPQGCAEVSPTLLAGKSDAPDGARALRDVLAEARLEVVEEAGIIRGEVLGLEVARIMELGAEHRALAGLDLEAADSDPMFGIDIGVGKFDQEIGRMLQTETVPVAALTRTADYVRLNRSVDAGPHPLAMLCRERWLRIDWLAQRGIDLDDACFVEPPIEREALRESSICGVLIDNALHAFATGIDLDTIPQVADMAARCESERSGAVVSLDEVHLYVADPTLARVQQRLVPRLGRPITVHVMPAPWERLTA